jgi:hypothetical protein
VDYRINKVDKATFGIVAGMTSANSRSMLNTCLSGTGSKGAMRPLISTVPSTLDAKFTLNTADARAFRIRIEGDEIQTCCYGAFEDCDEALWASAGAR